MRRASIPFLLLIVSLASCAYVSNGEFMIVYDADGDGWPVGEDCDDGNEFIYPYAPDLRGDGCDADCSMEPDADGDDWPDDADCDPEDPSIYPCSEDEVAGDGKDSDCDGEDGPRDDQCVTSDPGFEGAITPPGCL